MKIAAIVLAAGASRRLGSPKQLLSMRGRPLVRVIAEEALASSCAAVAVVTGAHADATRDALAGLQVACVHNPNWAEGIASSIRAGVTYAAPFDAALLMVCDQPRLDRTHLDRLAGAFVAGAVASRYAGVLGVPAVFGRALFPLLFGLRGDKGAREVLRGARPLAAIEWPDGAFDLDVPADLERDGIGGIRGR
jgi:molybdenum cofactor cytidylyltransferase